MATLAGEFHGILGFFSSLPARRLVVLGPAGAGKSGQASREPVPVIVPAGSWRPGADLAGWTAEQLAGTRPALALRVRSATHGRARWPRRWWPMAACFRSWNGLDELSEPMRVRALA